MRATSVGLQRFVLADAAEGLAAYFGAISCASTKARSYIFLCLGVADSAAIMNVCGAVCVADGSRSLTGLEAPFQ